MSANRRGWLFFGKGMYIFVLLFFQFRWKLNWDASHVVIVRVPQGKDPWSINWEEIFIFELVYRVDVWDSKITYVLFFFQKKGTGTQFVGRKDKVIGAWSEQEITQILHLMISCRVHLSVIVNTFYATWSKMYSPFWMHGSNVIHDINQIWHVIEWDALCLKMRNHR